MALNLPTPGESARLAPMRVSGPVVPKTFAPKVGKAPRAPRAPGVNPNDAVTLSRPYDPSQIQTTAQSAFSSDVANEQRLAAMGYPRI